MLELLRRIEPTVSKWIGNNYDHLCHPGKHKDFVEILLMKSGKIKLIVIYSQIGQKGTEQYYYMMNKHNLLFFAKDIHKNNVDKTLKSCQLIMSKIGPFLPKKSVVNKVSERVIAALSDEQKFHDDLVSHLRRHKLEFEDSDQKIGFFFNCAEIDVFDEEVLVELDQAVNQFETSAGEDDVGVDIFGDRGPIKRTPSFPVNVPKIGYITIYGRNKDSLSDQAYSKLSVDCCPLTVKNAIKLKSTLTALSEDERTTTVTNVDGSPKLVIVCPSGLLPGKEKVVECTEPIIEYAVKKKFEKKSKKKEKAEVKAIETSMSLMEFRESTDKLHDTILGLATTDIDDIEFSFGVFSKTSASSSFVITDMDLTIPAKKLAEQTKLWGEQAARCNYNIFSKTFGSLGLRPVDVPGLVNKCWPKSAGIAAGKFDSDLIKTKDVKFISLTDALRLYLHDDVTVANKIIKIISKNHLNLLIDIGTRKMLRKHTKDKKEDLFLLHKRRDVLQLPLLISVCFQKGGMNMNELDKHPGLNLGRLCSLMSEAQILYNTRDGGGGIPGGGMPGKLVGSEYCHMFLSGRSPQVIYARMTKRVSAYLDYLKRRMMKDKDSKEAIVWKTHRKISNQICETGGIPNKLNAEEMSLLALGYSSNPKRKELDNEEPEESID